MNSLIALDELRAAKAKKQQLKLQCTEVKKELEKINLLRSEKAALTARLEALTEGSTVDELDAHQPPSVRERLNILHSLQEKLCAYRLFGPCGLTVVAVDADCLVVTFTSMWKSITEAFVLKIVAVDGQVKVSGTTIPYFIDVQSMLDKSKSPAWRELMDDICRKLNAYVRRKGELDFVMKEYEDYIKTSSTNESVTSIEMVVHHQEASSEIDKTLTVYLVYPDVDTTLPDTVNISAEKVSITAQMIEVLTQKFQSSPLSAAVPALIGALEACAAADFTDESDEEDDDSR